MGLCKRGSTEQVLRKGFGKMAPKAMKAKAMKAHAAMKVMNLHLKRPAASGLGALPSKEGMSLEEKMELFKKKGNQDVSAFLDGLTKQQREALWQRFASARDSLKDSESDSLWQEVGKGKGSEGPKKKLLGTFLKLGGDLKGKKDLWLKELVAYSKGSGLLAGCIDFASAAVCEGPVKGLLVPAFLR